MGGYGSGSNSHYSARTTTGDCIRLRMSYLLRNGKLNEKPTLLLLQKGRKSDPFNWIHGSTSKYSMKVYNGSPKPNKIDTTQIVWTPCQFGGERPWFVCRECLSRVAVLYYRHSKFLCRYCQNLPYASTRQSPWTRANNQRLNLKAKIGANGTGPVDKPKGMHWKTYYKLINELDRLNRYVFGTMSKRTDSLNARLRRFYTK